MNIQELSAPAITLHQTLNPDLWDENDSLSSDVKAKLDKIAGRFIGDVGLTDAAVQDVVVTGSNCGFNYSESSPVVLLVVADIPDDEVYQEIIAERVTDYALSRHWQVNGCVVEACVVASSYDVKGSRFSLTENRWLERPNRRRVTEEDASVVALLEKWSRIQERVTKDRGLFETVNEQWDRFSGSLVEGSCEQMVVQTIGERLNRLLAECRVTKKKPVKETFVYGYHSSSKNELRQFIETVVPPLPEIRFKARVNSMGADPFNRAQERTKVWEWAELVESNLKRLSTSFEEMCGVSASEHSRAYLGRRLAQWKMQESVTAKTDIINELLGYTRVNTTLPKVGEEITLYEFVIDEVWKTVDINIYNDQRVLKTIPNSDEFELQDREIRTMGRDRLGSQTIVCGWVPGGTDNRTAMLLMACDHDGDEPQLNGWKISVVDNANLQESKLSQWRHLYNRIKEDAEPTPDGVNPTTCMFLNEKDGPVKKADVIKEFFHLCVKALQIEHPPTVQLRRDPAWSARNKTFGRYNPAENTMELSLADRNIMDICRTLCHELVHCRQNEKGELGPNSGADGSPQENEANSVAGDIMRKWGKLHPEFFTAENIEESASGYIPTKKQAKDPRWSMALTQDIKPGEVGRQANKMALATDRQGRPQVARADGKFERHIESELAESLALFMKEAAPASFMWKARVHIKQKGYDGYIDTQIAAPDMRRARTLIAAMYGVKDSDIGSTTKVK